VVGSPEWCEMTAAYYEAGHVVVGLRLGLKLDYATVVLADGFDGRTKWKSGGDGEANVTPQVIQALAGLSSEVT
jgi:hypothetical protein